MSDRPRSLRAEALVLRHRDWGEADRLLTLYTRRRGKLRAIVKGARKLRSRKAGHLEPFTHVALLMAAGHDLWIVTQAETISAYLMLRDDLVLTGYAAYLIELVDRFTYEDEANPSIFNLCIQTLKRLNDGQDAFMAIRYFEMRLLDQLGYRPELTQCVNCRAEIQAEDQFFSALQGGVICPKCVSSVVSPQPIGVDVLRYLRHFQRSNYREALRARIPAAVQTEIESFMQGYLTYLLERRLNSPNFLRDVRDR
jgi:DNA repair protein RecO (recombination protein O)